MKPLFAIIILLIAGCASLRGPDPQVALQVTTPDAEEQARAYASAHSCRCYLLPNTGSMLPFLHEGDWIVIDRHADYDSIQPGDICGYYDGWHHLLHMAVCKWGDETWGMAGINGFGMDPHAMTRKNFSGKVVAVFHTHEYRDDDPGNKAWDKACNLYLDFGITEKF